MPKFIELHLFSGEKVLVNIDHVVSVSPRDDSDGSKSKVYLVGGNDRFLKESYNEVMELINA